MTKTRTQKMIEEIIKNAEYVEPNKKSFHGTWIENGCQYCTDTHRIVMFYNPVEAKQVDVLPTVDIDKIFSDAETECTETISLPSVKEIREQIKNLIGRKYKSNRVFYRLGDNPKLAIVNAKYLVECMELIGATEIKYNPRKPRKSALYMETELGKVILLPIYNTNENVGYWSLNS